MDIEIPTFKEDLISELFELSKNKNETEIINLIDKNKNFDFNFKNNESGTYFIFSIIIFNLKKVFTHLVNFKISLDVLDNDGRTIIYYLIKLNHLELLKDVIKYYENFIGIPIINLKDNFGLSCLHYCVIFNNSKALDLLYQSKNINLMITDNKGNNILLFSILNKNNNILNYLLDKNYPIKTKNFNNENVLHLLLNNFPEKKLIKYFQPKIPINEQDKNYLLTPLHLSLILNIDLGIYNFNKELQITDFYGNTPLHYGLVEGNITLFKNIIEKNLDKINYNIQNINGDTLLHLILEENIRLDDNLMQIFVNQTNLNLQNNQGNTCIHLLITNNLFNDFTINQKINIFIQNKDGKTPFQLDDHSKQKDYYDKTAKILGSILLKNKNKSKLDWEKNCKTKIDCVEKIKEYLIKEKRNPPFTQDEIIPQLQEGLIVEQCRFLGITIDILSGILFLKHKYENTSVLLQFPLTSNEKLIAFYQTMAIDLSYKTDFINFQIYWVYQKIFFPSYFDFILTKYIKDDNIKFIVIPLGIENDIGAHANILIIDKKHKIVERFEPYGIYPPKELNYNSLTLDDILENKFNEYDLKYVKPIDYLPKIGFQVLENLETPTCKQIGDPNGFCAVWCIWWAYHKILNNQIESSVLAEKLINKVKINNLSFKAVIRNFSKNITDVRDELLEEVDLDINKWIQGKYDDKAIKQLENIILKF